MDSPLHAAAEKDCTAVVKLLLDFGADINARNTEFQRPVDVAPPSSLTEGFLLLYEGITWPLACSLWPLLHSCCSLNSTATLSNSSSSHFQSYTTSAEPAVSSVHQKLRRPWQTPPSFSPSPAKQDKELPAVPLTGTAVPPSAYVGLTELSLWHQQHINSMNSS